MATGWRPNKIKPVKGPKAPKVGRKGTPKVDSLKVTPVGPGIRGGRIPGVGMHAKPPKGTKAVRPGAPAPAAAWYDKNSTAARDASIASALSDPLKPVTGTDAVSFARALAQSGIAPILQDYDRQASLAESRAGAQSKRTTAGNEALRGMIAQQLAGQQASAATARDRISSAGTQLQSSIDQGGAQAGQAAVVDAATRGAGLDGGAAAERAQELANAKARGLAGTNVVLDQQATNAQTSDAFLNQISAATAQQGGERLGAITSALSGQLRDVNEGRSKALASGEQTFLKAIMDLKSDNTQTALATETLGLNKEQANADTAIKAAQLKQQAEIASLNAKIKVAEGQAQRDLRKQLAEATERQRALDRAARTSTADKNRGAANARQDKALEAREDKKKETAKGKLSPKDRSRREFITNVKVAQESGQLAAMKKKAKNNPSTYRTLLAEDMGVNDAFSRQLLADLAFGGLRGNTIRAYRAKYGRNPPNDWPKYRKPKPNGMPLADGIADAVGKLG